MTTAREIIDFLDAAGQVQWLHEPDPDMGIDRPASLEGSAPGSVSFLTSTAPAPDALMRSAAASLVVVDSGAELSDRALATSAVGAVIRSGNARLDFMRVVEAFFVRASEPGVHPTAVVSSAAVVGTGVAIGPLCTVADDCRIGDGSVLEAGVHLYAGVIVGQRVHIHAGAVLGADGFGYERGPDGRLVKFPHVGHVEVGDDVEIGANACIDRGTLGATEIGRGAKIDNLVHIGHNVRIGEDAVVIALAMVGGSTEVGARAWISPSACLRDNIDVGEDAIVGLAAVVTKDVPSGATVLGAPARPIAEHRRLLDVWAAAAREAAP